MAMKKIKSDSSKITIDQFYTDEIVIGLCAPIGVDLDCIVNALEEKLGQYNYEVKKIRLSSIIKEMKGEGVGSCAIEVKKDLINKGNEIRRENGRAAYIAEKAIEQTFLERLEYFPDGKYASRRVCTIINSIKNSAEHRLFKEIYGESFYLLGVFSSNEVRIRNLTGDDKKLLRDAEDLIKVDHAEAGGFGQEVGKVFHSADYFIRLEGPAQVDLKIERYLKLIFDTEVITPDIHESAMFEAASAARNSACLSRQVGAAIVNDDGLIISTGWNDVPKFGGGTYKSGPLDKRCFNDGKYCRNDKNKNHLVSSVIDELIHQGIVTSGNRDGVSKILFDSAIGDLIEYSRAVHAEMHAILNAGRSKSGHLVDSVLYCTTYPCHSCARHIVASGIKEVYFIEPYPKSRAVTLHSDSITEDEGAIGKLKLLAYEGVAPSRYLAFFAIKDKRKDSVGSYHPNRKVDASPKIAKIFESIYLLEASVAERFNPSPDDGGGEEITNGKDDSLPATKAA
ncbi:MAG: anti-phage dCTP deaminase [Proteobacteria bacterium]|nr:anti-phage dCTP deaminase [Pseudomonadota bacterium]